MSAQCDENNHNNVKNVKRVVSAGLHIMDERDRKHSAHFLIATVGSYNYIRSNAASIMMWSAMNKSQQRRSVLG